MTGESAGHHTGSFTGAGRLTIFWQSWTPVAPVRGLVVIVHGAGEHSSRYAHVAARLVAEGYGVYALDQRGHGRSEGRRVLIDRIANAVADVDGLLDIATAAHPGAGVFLLGHSLGGAIALSYALAHQQRLTGLILSGPLAALDAAPAPVRLAGRLLSALAPGLPLIAVDSSLISRDPQVVEAYRRDPLVHHGKLPARTVAELAAAIDGYPGAVARITVPTLILYGTADALCPPAGSVMLGERIGADDVTVTPYAGLFHEILNEPERDAVLDEICGWLSVRSSTAGRAAAGSSTS